jgi:hypothetical protein
VQVALDPAQPGRRLVDHAGAPLLRLAGALGGLRVPFGFQSGGPLLERGVIGTPVAVGHRVAEHPRGQRRAAKPDGRGEQCRPGVGGVRWSPAEDRRDVAEQADDEAVMEIRRDR